MLRTTLKNLAARKLRLLTTSFAVLLGVAFMAGTLVLTATVGATFDSLFADAYEGTDAAVRGEVALESSQLGDQRNRLDAALVDEIQAVDGVAAAGGYIEGFAQLVGADGEVIGDPNMGAPVVGGIWLDDEELNPFQVVEGRAPTADHEVVIDRHSADVGDLAVGDIATVLTQAGALEVDVVGVTTFVDHDSPGGASFTLFTPEAAQANLTEPGRIDTVLVRAEDGLSQADLVARIEPLVPSGTEVLTGEALTAETQAEIKSEMGFLTTFLMAFAVIALFVGSFIIYNSFSILVAQRTREMALMRAIGASRRQVMGSVLLEAVAVGLVASVAGIVAGIGIALGLKALLNGMGIDFPAGGVVLGSSTVIVSLIAGVGISVAAAVFPARRASKVAPMAAMRDVAVDDSARSRKRTVAGLAVTTLGAAAMGAGLFGDGGPGPVGLGALVVFLGAAVLGPVLARPMSRLLGCPGGFRARPAGLAGPGERHAESQAHRRHGLGADDRCGPGGLHHDHGVVDEGVDRRERRAQLHRRPRRRVRLVRNWRPADRSRRSGGRATRGRGGIRLPGGSRRGRRALDDADERRSVADRAGRGPGRRQRVVQRARHQPGGDQRRRGSRQRLGAR